jgi:hypothetical protein
MISSQTFRGIYRHEVQQKILGANAEFLRQDQHGAAWVDRRNQAENYSIAQVRREIRKQQPELSAVEQ